MPKPDVLLYDDVNAWTHLKAQDALPHFRYRQPNAVHQGLLMRYRSVLRDAQRFYIDDEFIHTSLKASHDMRKVERWTPLARLPFKKIWIEFDCHEKVRASITENTLATPQEHDMSQVSRRMGFLMETIDDETGVWVMTTFADQFIRTPSGELDIRALPDSTCYFLAPEGPNQLVIRPPMPWGDPEVVKRLGAEIAIDPSAAHMGHIALGVKHHSNHTLQVGETRYARVHEFENRLTVFPERFVGLSFEMAERDNPSKKKELESLFSTAFTRCLTENAGIVRWAITILAMMNEAPNVKHYFPPEKHSRLYHGKSVPYLGHNVVTLKLPKNKAVPFVVRKLDKHARDRARNRRHKVRGFWRVSEKGIKTPFACKHEPTMVLNGVGFCPKCQRKIRWIDDFERGDAAIGYVQHDYMLEAS